MELNKGDVARIADHLLYVLDPLFEENRQNKYKKLMQLYRAGKRDGMELSLVLAEIAALEDFQINLKGKSNKAKRELSEEVKKHEST